MRLRILSLNIWALPLGLARSTPERVRAIGERLASFDADLLCFQEVWTAVSRGLLVAAGGRAGFAHVWHRSRSFGGSGLLILSRLPIVQARFESYRLAGLPQRVQHADYYGGKGFATVTVETQAGPVAILDTHLQAGYVAPGEADEYTGVRVAQLVQLSSYLAGLDLPVVAAGDFNTQEGDREYDILLGLTGMLDVAAALDQREPTCLAGSPYRALHAPDQRIDLILTRRGRSTLATPSQIRRVLDEPIEVSGEPGRYSDHAGLLAEIDIRAAAEPSLDRGLAPPRIESIDAARALLSVGREVSLERRESEWRYAGASALLGALCALGMRRLDSNRRSFLRSLLRMSLGSLSGLGLAGGAGMAVLGERVTAGELQGYDEMAGLLDQLQSSAGEASVAAP